MQQSARHQAMALLVLLQLFTLGIIVNSQDPVREGVFPFTVKVLWAEKISTQFKPGIKVELTCTVTTPGSSFYVWVKDLRVVGRDPKLTITLDDRNIYGNYRCIAQPPISANTYASRDYVITEMPSTMPQQIRSVSTGTAAVLACTKTSPTNSFKWYKYNEKSYRFEEVPGATTMELRIDYNDLSKDHDAGFTFYKCASNVAGVKEEFEFFKVNKQPAQALIDGRPTKIYDLNLRDLPNAASAIPNAIVPKSKVTFECHRESSTTGDTVWSFRKNSKTSYNEIVESADVTIDKEDSKLSIKNCDVKNKGYYKCTYGSKTLYAFMDIQIVVPTIHEYSKSEYDMSSKPGDTNEFECEVPIGGEAKDIVWRIIRSDNTYFDVAANKQVNQFRSKVAPGASNRLGTIVFKDSMDYDNYTLQCRLGDEIDYLTLVYKDRRPTIRWIRKFIHYKSVTAECSFPKFSGIRYRDQIRFYWTDNKDDKVTRQFITAMDVSGTTATMSSMFNSATQWLRCSVPDGPTKRAFSEPIRALVNPIQVTMEIDGAPIGDKKEIAKLIGQPLKFTCIVSNLTINNLTGIISSDIDQPNRVELSGNAAANQPANSDKESDKRFNFNIANPQPGDSADFNCNHHLSRGYTLQSSKIRVNFCDPRQHFICDGQCKNRSVLCDKVADCKDGTDEDIVQCDGCQPNEVPCRTFNGRKPSDSVKCVLKHWLCDGQDDCENGYDEESELAKKWCTNNCLQNTSLNCPPNSTCCPSGDKCIPRFYECDNIANDCPGNTDEDSTKCCQLRITEPTASQTLLKMNGSQVMLTCRAVGFERPTLNWRCNWGSLRSPERMTENFRTERQENGLYHVVNTLVIKDFNKADECIYNCEAITRCKQELSPEMTIIGK